MNIEGSRTRLTYTEFVKAMGECFESVEAVAMNGPELEDAVSKLHERVKTNNINIAEVAPFR